MTSLPGLKLNTALQIKEPDIFTGLDMKKPTAHHFTGVISGSHLPSTACEETKSC